ncbi:MAG TPA: CpaF family protein, partial [Pirellulales bacterium]
MATDLAAQAARDKWEQFKLWLTQQIADRMGDLTGDKNKLTETLNRNFQQIVEATGVNLTPVQKKTLQEEIGDEILGFGPIGPLLRDQSISEIMVNGPKIIFVERKGKLVETEVKFRDDDHIIKIIDRIVRPMGRTCDRKNPKVDARLPDGSRVNAIIPPCAIDGPCLTIRKFAAKKLQIEDLIGFKSLTPNMAEFLKACVLGKLNVVVSGGTGSGKTTLLNLLSGYIPSDERVVTIEDSAELQLMQRHVVRLETKPAEPDGSAPAVPIRELVINSLRMRPERIIVGECRGGEALDMLQAMNTGHDGSMTTTHANTPRDCLARLETLCLMSGMDLPVKVIRQQISKAVHLIVQASRLRDGSRKITHITEVVGMEGETITMQDI